VDDRDGMESALSRVDTSTPHPARRYDYLLGGKDNFAADREAGDEIVARHPSARLSVWENRWFLHRAVRFMAAEGIRQFLDIGTGIPTSPNTHEIAQRANPTSRVVYVDNDHTKLGCAYLRGRWDGPGRHRHELSRRRRNPAGALSTRRVGALVKCRGLLGGSRRPPSSMAPRVQASHAVPL
jgi:hypothetical protein